jgi:hypothetical protein
VVERTRAFGWQKSNICGLLTYPPGMIQFRASRALLLPCLLSALPVSVSAQSPKRMPQDELFKTIASLDAALFASASYDRCDIDTFKSFFRDDVEFYHDQGGLTVGSQHVAEQVRKNICGVSRRELVAGTHEVYPMHGYGAVQTGAHRFYQPKQGPGPTGVAKFIHLWEHKDGKWRIARVISYDHVALSQ